jgi:hypothetical protein
MFDESIKNARNLNASNRTKITALNKEVEELTNRTRELNKAIKN